MEPNRVKSDAYFLLTIKWVGGFTHQVPCRGYSLKSQLDFTRSLTYVEEFTYAECDQAEYDRRVFGIGEEECQSPVVADTKSKISTKRTASQSKRGQETSVKRSAMSASAKPATKNTSVKKKSSTVKKKN